MQMDSLVLYRLYLGFNTAPNPSGWVVFKLIAIQNGPKLAKFYWGNKKVG